MTISSHRHTATPPSSDARGPLVVCVVLNTNRRDDTLACLGSVFGSTYPNLGVVLLDCQSTDGSVAAVRAAYPGTHVVELTTNLGYAGNNNVGIQVALDLGADWVFVLNEDVVLSTECVAQLVEVGEQSPDIGIVGPMVYHHDEPTVIQSAGGGLTPRWEGFHFGQNEPDRGQYREPHDVQWISGCAILVRRPVIRDVGMLDARFFIYWEETEWCVRASEAGWRIVHVPDAQLWHKGVQRDYRPQPSVTYYFTRNRLLLLRLHRAPLSAWITAGGQILRTLASWTLRPKWRSKRLHRDAMWQGVVDFARRRWGRQPTRSAKATP